jgi:PTH1 family peptidyl-tRNA hydrolase
MLQKYLIAGLGNFEKRYEDTRHNIGFEVVKKLAHKKGATFSEKPKVKGLVASFSFDGGKVYLLMPLTYMNDSGVSVRSMVDFHKIPLENVLIIVDDIAIDFGKTRMRLGSGSGGHNGLKSIEEHLQTKNYARLRVGIGDREKGDLASFVLGKFTPEEQKDLTQLIEKSSQCAEFFYSKDLAEAMSMANVNDGKSKNKEIKNDNG